MGLLVLVILIFFIVIFDKKYHATYYTPSILLAVPLLSITILYDLYAPSLGFFPLNYNVLYIWVFGLFIFWIVGLLSNFFVKITPYNVSLEERKKDILFFGKYLTKYSFLLSIFLLYYLYNAYNIYKSSGGDAVEIYLGGGVQAHFTIILKILSIISVLCVFGNGSLVFKLKNYFVIFVTISLSVLYATKSGLLILLIAYFFSIIFFYKKKINLLHVAIALSFGFIIFYLSYSLVFGELADIDFIWNHMVLYYVCGVASMNAYFQGGYESGIDPELLFQSLYNIVYTFSGDSSSVKSIISEEWTYIGNSTSINVKTFFGTIYLYGGELIGIVSIVLFSIIIHILFKLSKGQNSFFFLILYSYFLAMLCFGWFDFYFNNVATIESVVVCVFLNLFYKLRINRG